MSAPGKTVICRVEGPVTEPLASTHWRGEVGLRGNPGEGAYRNSQPRREAPHPNLLPAHGEKASPRCLFRRFRIGRRCREQRQKRSLDRRLARRRRDLRAGQVGNIKHVHHPFAERSDMGRGNIEIELRKCRCQLVEEAGPIKSGDFDDRVAVRPLIIDRDFRLDGERLQPAFWRRALGNDFRQFQLAAHGFFNGVADPRGAACLVFVAFEFARYRDGV